MEYTEPRATKDLDILIECSKENAKNVYSALKEFGAGLQGITADFFAEKGQFYKMGRPPFRVDIITSAKGAPFKTTWKDKNSKKINDTIVYYASIKQLIAMKKAAGRPQDLIDLEKLEKVSKVISKIRK